MGGSYQDQQAKPCLPSPHGTPTRTSLPQRHHEGSHLPANAYWPKSEMKHDVLESGGQCRNTLITLQSGLQSLHGLQGYARVEEPINERTKEWVEWESVALKHWIVVFTA
jgi:hypothetical protein